MIGRNTKRRHWTYKDEEQLKQLFGKLTVRAIADRLQRSIQSIRTRAAKLGLTSGKRWSDEARAYVKKHYRKKTNEELAEHLGVTTQAIRTLLHNMKLHRIHYHRWSTHDKIILKRMYGKMPNSKLAKRFGVSSKTLEITARRFGFSREPYPKYSEEELEFVRVNYHKMRHKEIAEKVGRSVNSIENLARRRGWPLGNPDFARPYTKKEDEFILRNAGKLTQKEMAERLGRTYKSINKHVQVLKKRKARGSAN